MVHASLGSTHHNVLPRWTLLVTYHYTTQHSTADCPWLRRRFALPIAPIWQSPLPCSHAILSLSSSSSPYRDSTKVCHWHVQTGTTDILFRFLFHVMLRILTLSSCSAISLSHYYLCSVLRHIHRLLSVSWSHNMHLQVVVLPKVWPPTQQGPSQSAIPNATSSWLQASSGKYGEIAGKQWTLVWYFPAAPGGFQVIYSCNRGPSPWQWHSNDVLVSERWCNAQVEQRWESPHHP